MRGFNILLEKLLRSVRSRPVVKDTISTTAFTLLGRGVGFLIPFFIAAWFGVTQETDAFFFAYGLLLFLISLLGSLFETAVVPFVSSLWSRNKEVGKFIGSTLLTTTVFLLIAGSPLMVIVKPLIAVSTGFKPEGVHLICNLALEMVPLVFIVAWTSILNGALNANRSFVVPALSPGVRSVVVIVLTFLFKDMLGIHALAWAYLAGEVLRLVPSLYFFRKEYGPIRWFWRWNREAGPFFRGAFFQTGGLIFLGLIPIVNQAMASWMGTGYSSAFFYADRLYFIPSLLLSTGLATVLLSHWSNTYSRKPEDLSREKVQPVIWKVVLIAGSISLLFLVFRDLLVDMTLHRGEFPSAQVSLVSGLFGIAIIGLAPAVMNLLYFRLLVIYNKNHIYLGINFIRFLLVIGLSLLWMPRWGIYGLALSNLTSGLVMLLALHGYWVFLHRTIPSMAKAQPQEVDVT